MATSRADYARLRTPGVAIALTAHVFGRELDRQLGEFDQFDQLELRDLAPRLHIVDLLSQFLLRRRRERGFTKLLALLN